MFNRQQHITPSFASAGYPTPDLYAMQADDDIAALRIALLMKLRTQGIHDTKVLNAIEAVPREEYIPENLHAHAYEDTALPIDGEQSISQPGIVATMTQALAIENTHKILEIGTGSGYQTAILAKLARRIYTLERQRTLHQQATARFRLFNLHNIITRYGDGHKGWQEAAPFQRILITAACNVIPEKLLEQLAPGGIMVAPLTQAPGMQRLMKITRGQGGDYTYTPLMEVRFVPMLRGIC